MKHLDLFSGIGGFALAARWVGWETIGFCEIEPYCQKVLAKHWPGVPIFNDVKTIMADAAGSGCNPDGRTGKAVSQPGAKQRSPGCNRCITDGSTTVGPVDIITGGFPCQDISYAGKGAGLEGERSGLWTELARIIGEVRPRYAVLENVAALLSRGLDRVAGDLAEIGYDCEWHCIPASAVGAPHRRDRIWIVAFPNTLRPECEPGAGRRGFRQGDTELADTHLPRLEGWLRRGLQERASERTAGEEDSRGPGSQWLVEPNVGQLVDGLSAGLARFGWLPEPGVGRVATGVPDRVNKLRGLGNAIVPQVAQVIFDAINAVERDRV